MTPKLAIMTEIIAPYRIPVFNALAERKGIDFHAIFLSENDPVLRQWRVYKNEIKFSFDVLPSWRRRIGGYNVLLNHGVQSLLQKLKPDVLICGGYNYLASWQAAFWANSHRIPLVLWSESTAFDARRRHWWIELLKSRFLSLCSAFAVPGKSSFQYLRELGVAGPIFTAPNAVDVRFFSTAAESARRAHAAVRARRALPARYFLYVGRLVKEKGVFDLLEAYAGLTPGLRAVTGLVFVGEGAARAALERQASHIEGDVRFYGFAHREDLPEFYALGDALVFPTYSDTWGLVVNEAMACGLPIIATDVAGCAADLVKDGENGFVLPPHDPARLALLMTRMAEDCGCRAEMSARSRELVSAYSPEAWAEGMVEGVKAVLGARA
ncbi:MAG TPA: glycosyltransferase family 4 protein [Candidatus Binatia bacterium]|nr:glycosyltransferase family 4 protein [Candidatus Binatia bacterium]